jgi:8-oxo-dGTP diphosphatase
MAKLPYRISVLVFLKDAQGRHLLIQRRKAPNDGLWSPIGGKLEMATGESPFECAIRETREEVGLALTESDLHLFGMIAEKAYEGGGHWLMFLFDAHKPIDAIPPEIAEGRFGFFTRAEIDGLALPETDREALWKIYDKNRTGFVTLRANCDPTGPLQVTVEQLIGNGPSR